MNSNDQPLKEKPTLTLVKSDSITAELLDTLYEKLTGRRMTEEELTSTRKKLADRSPT